MASTAAALPTPDELEQVEKHARALLASVEKAAAWKVNGYLSHWQDAARHPGRRQAPTLENLGALWVFLDVIGGALEDVSLRLEELRARMVDLDELRRVAA